ncbi:MAG: hypothetical protein HIU86_13090 [Acidobacteria bacterium]|nr:hypothetical protein [Acidobacteriota bacterium]
MDSNRSHDPRRVPAANWAASYPYATDQPPRQQGPRQASIPQPTPVGQQATYPYDRRPQQPPRYEPPTAPRAAQKSSTRRRLLGVLAFLVLTALSLPLHVAAIFFIYVEFESPGDPLTAVLLIGAAFIGSFAALFVTGLLSQRIGAFPGLWRARVTFAALSGVIALAIAYLGATKLL